MSSSAKGIRSASLPALTEVIVLQDDDVPQIKHEVDPVKKEIKVKEEPLMILMEEEARPIAKRSIGGRTERITTRKSRLPLYDHSRAGSPIRRPSIRSRTRRFTKHEDLIIFNTIMPNVTCSIKDAKRVVSMLDGRNMEEILDRFEEIKRVMVDKAWVDGDFA